MFTICLATTSLSLKSCSFCKRARSLSNLSAKTPRRSRAYSVAIGARSGLSCALVMSDKPVSTADSSINACRSSMDILLAQLPSLLLLLLPHCPACELTGQAYVNHDLTQANLRRAGDRR